MHVLTLLLGVTHLLCLLSRCKFHGVPHRHLDFAAEVPFGTPTHADTRDPAVVPTPPCLRRRAPPLPQASARFRVPLHGRVRCGVRGLFAARPSSDEGGKSGERRGQTSVDEIEGLRSPSRSFKQASGSVQANIWQRHCHPNPRQRSTRVKRQNTLNSCENEPSHRLIHF